MRSTIAAPIEVGTGIHQNAAIRLYEQEGFRRIPPFGDYSDDPVSLCYEKRNVSWTGV